MYLVSHDVGSWLLIKEIINVIVSVIHLFIYYYYY